MNNKQDKSLNKIVIVGFTFVVLVQVLGIWYLANQGVQRTQEILQSNVQILVEVQKMEAQLLR